jgi:glycosyltransferase involved in cell wall biosynthesis
VEKLKNPPLVCICIPTYNAEATIKDMLQSVLSQSYENLVIHVCDNASDDRTLEILDSFSDHRLHIHRYENNIGAEGNFNRCIQLSEGEFTAIFHSDDLYEQDIIASQVEYLGFNSSVGAVFTAARVIDSQGSLMGLIGRSGAVLRGIEMMNFQALLKRILKNGNFIVCPSAMVRTVIYRQEIKEWRASLFHSSADLDVWLRIASNHKVAFIAEPLMRYRIDNNQFSSTVRLRTKRADFLSVVDFYLTLPSVAEMLDIQDLENINQQILNDRLWRAINHFINGNIEEAKGLISGFLSAKNLIYGLRSRRGILMALSCMALNIMVALKLKKSGRVIINLLRSKIKK